MKRSLRKPTLLILSTAVVNEDDFWEFAERSKQYGYVEGSKFVIIKDRKGGNPYKVL
ncbi:hypothetical protein [Echinicola sp. 20G]|uniref:hypothetical protein n=1 Tax=Echinicola sp. 20G TaxID=2781961 RepID=UPI001910592E|nr:hypothetical protein [Echinicola sp. 20G]